VSHMSSLARAGLAAFSACFLACATPEPAREQPFVAHTSAASDPSRPCDIQVAEEVKLSPREVCVLNLHKARCGKDDICIVSCIANGMDRVRGSDGRVERIAGGCWHVCSAYRDGQYTVPDGMDRCDKLGASTS